MFSKKPANRKLNQKRRSRSNHKPRKETLDSLRDKEYQLNAQIGELEEILATKEREEARQKSLRHKNILPPPDYGFRHRRGHEEMTYSEKRRKSSERNASGLYFFVLLVIASALAFWLFYSGG